MSTMEPPGAAGASAAPEAEPDKPRLSVPSTVVGSAAIFGLVFGSAKAHTDGCGWAVTLAPLIADGLI